VLAGTRGDDQSRWARVNIFHLEEIVATGAERRASQQACCSDLLSKKLGVSWHYQQEGDVCGD
jgi:hypothetical protein